MRIKNSTVTTDQDFSMARYAEGAYTVSVKCHHTLSKAKGGAAHTDLNMIYDRTKAPKESAEEFTNILFDAAKTDRGGISIVVHLGVLYKNYKHPYDDLGHFIIQSNDISNKEHEANVTQVLTNFISADQTQRKKFVPICDQ